jgi:predicted AlkP superfamily phosphohydrolase/phosphomutase
MKSKLLVIGLDGASFNVLDPLVAQGLLPNIAGLMSGGTRGDLETTFPPITAVAWSSFMTGRNPGRHGIFEFVRRGSDNREHAVNASFRDGRAIWEVLGEAGYRVVVHNFPCTYPPRPVNGVLIADFMTPRGRRDFTYPGPLLDEIEERFGPYRLHLSQTYSKGNVGKVLDELDDELDYKAKVSEYLVTRQEWDGFFQYFWGTDRIQHELWHLIDETHPRHDPLEAAAHRERVFDYFHRVDEAVGRLIALSEGAQVWLLSDHGFGPVHKYCSFNIWLLREGFLRLKADLATRLKQLMFFAGLTPAAAFKIVRKLPLGRLRPSRGVSQNPRASSLLSRFFLSFSDVDWSRTVAFSKGNYGQIYINLKNREPHGIVPPEEYEATREMIIARLQRLEDPATGEQWVDRVFRREELYEGPRVGDAPDIAFLPRDMRYLPLGNTDFTSNKFITDSFGISGSHRMNGVLIGSGQPLRRGARISGARIIDVAPTILYALGQSIPAEMDGVLLEEMISEDYLAGHPASFAGMDRSGPDRSGPARSEEYSDEENDDVIERLKSLGYIG